MEHNQQRIIELETQVQQLSQLLGAKFNEINHIRQELEKLKSGTSVGSPGTSVPAAPAAPSPAVINSPT